MLRSGSSMGPACQRGLSIVELMVGIAIGLIIVAAASLLMSGQLHENRRLLAETQLQQDLRAASDIITRELRRVGADVEAQSLQSLWFPGRTTAVQENVFAEPLTPLAGAPPSTEVLFTYNPGPAANANFGFKLEGGAIKTRLLSAGWQELTDPRVMTVTSFTITRDADTQIQLPCAKRCPVTNDAACWPKLSLRNLSVAITASAAAVPGIDRSIRTRVRLRNDFLRFSAPGLVCPI